MFNIGSRTSCTLVLLLLLLPVLGYCYASNRVLEGSMMLVSFGITTNLWKKIASSLHFGVVAIEKGAFGCPPTKLANFSYFIIACKEHKFTETLSKYSTKHLSTHPHTFKQQKIKPEKEKKKINK